MSPHSITVLLHHLKWIQYNYVITVVRIGESKSCKRIQNTICFIATQMVDIQKHWELNLELAKVWKMSIKTDDIPRGRSFRRCPSQVTWWKSWTWKLGSAHLDIPASRTLAAPCSICLQSQLFGSHQECFLIIIRN